MKPMKTGAFRKASGWFSLVLFLLAYLGPEIPALHSGHHDGPVAALENPAPGGPGASALASAYASGHACLLCLWKGHRDSGDALCAEPVHSGFLPFPVPGSAAPCAFRGDRLRISGPARAPPSLS